MPMTNPVQPALIEQLREEMQRRCGAPVEHVETHISHVLLAPQLAFKIKKPVRLPFVDFSSLATRRHCCQEELRLNRRLAPELYLDVVPVHDSPRGPTLDGEGPVVEYAVKMRRFGPGALLSERLASGTLVPAELERLAQRLADFHRTAPAADAASGYGAPSAIAAAARHALQGIEAADHAAEAADLQRWLDEQIPRLVPHWEARRAGGFVREGHGDLHLANAVVLGEDVTAFDCIEFDPALRWIDVLCDAGFLVMDLMAHGRSDLAFGFLDAYLAHTGDYVGLPVLNFYLVYRALVRAQVGLIREQQASTGSQQQGDAHGAPPSADAYLTLARALAQPPDPRLLVTHGLPGSGKSHVSRQLLEHVGAIRVRSDVERKRLSGLAALERSTGRDLYGRADTERTYARLLELARTGLAAGWPVIVDAAFGRRDERECFRALAASCAVPFTILDCVASADVLRDRVRSREARGNDPSDADVEVLERLTLAHEPLNARERALTISVDTAAPLDVATLAARWRRSRNAAAA